MPDLIGFSTGALALSDVEAALHIMGGHPVTAVELSALRLEELPRLVRAVEVLDLSRFQHVSIHAPSRFSAADEPLVVELLNTFSARGWPIVLHPDAISDFGAWGELGALLLI